MQYGALKGSPDLWDALALMTAHTVRSYRRGYFYHGNVKPDLEWELK
jgi:hypothetical protein